MSAHFASDTAALTGRSLRHITRSPDTIITTVITPIAIMLLFVYVFGGAIDTGTVAYVDYMLPGILLITIASGIAYTAVRLCTDNAVMVAWAGLERLRLGLADDLDVRPRPRWPLAELAGAT